MGRVEPSHVPVISCRVLIAADAAVPTKPESLKQLPALTPHPHHQCSRAAAGVAPTSQCSATPAQWQGGPAPLGSLHAVGQRLPTGVRLWPQGPKQHPIQAGVAVRGESLRHSATARIAMGVTRAARPRWQANNQWRPNRSTSKRPEHPEGKRRRSASKRPLIATAAGGVWISRDGSARRRRPQNSPRSTRSARRQRAMASAERRRPEIIRPLSQEFPLQKRETEGLRSASQASATLRAGYGSGRWWRCSVTEITPRGPAG